MRLKRLVIAVFLAAALLLPAAVVSAGAEDVPRLSTDELKNRLGEAGLVVLDVRTGWDWDHSPGKVAGAVRVDPGAVQDWAVNYPKQGTLVLYCA
jgi:rhodanese-related sulfurtransferase